MSKTIHELEPAALWELFGQLASIPRPSGHEEQIRDFVETFGKDHGLETLRDGSGNIIIRKPATPGKENLKGVILQGHLDMVPQKNSDKEHDFTKDPIVTLVEGDWVKADGTTLGADNGIGVSAALAILASSEVEHGPLEALFTATEETGMDGANGLEPGVLQGEILLNLDSEDEGELYVGCAGGEDAGAKFGYQERKTPKGMAGVKVAVTGMKGGHSGIDIGVGRGNAIKVLFRILHEAVCQSGARISTVNGGGLRNAIPREAFALVAVKGKKIQEFVTLVDELVGIIKGELAATEPGLTVTLEPVDPPKTILKKKDQEKLIKAIVACPNGVIRMSDSMPGLVETSTNLAIINQDGKKKCFTIACLMRSSVDTAKTELGSRISAVFTLAGATVKFTGAYPGWKPDMDSPILKTMREVYQSRFRKKPLTKAIHAGLECGILGGKYPHWDMISFGPTIRYPHSPDEKVNIPSVQKFWDFLLETLKHIPARETV